MAAQLSEAQSAQAAQGSLTWLAQTALPELSEALELPGTKHSSAIPLPAPSSMPPPSVPAEQLQSQVGTKSEKQSEPCWLQP